MSAARCCLKTCTRHSVFHPLHEKVAELLTLLQVPHLDLFNDFKYIPLERITVIPGVDRHPNEIAHRIAAESIIKWLGSIKILPESVIPKKIKNERIGI